MAGALHPVAFRGERQESRACGAPLWGLTRSYRGFCTASLLLNLLLIAHGFVTMTLCSLIKQKSMLKQETAGMA